MKKIICFIDDLCPGGAQRQLVGLSCLLKSKGYDVSLLTYHNNTFYKHILLEHGISHIYSPSFESLPSRIFRIASTIRKIQPDVVIAYQESPSLIACTAKLFGFNKKLLVSERNTTQKIGINEIIRFFLYRYADAIIPNSHSQEYFLQKKYPYLTEKIYTITNFVDTDYFQPLDTCMNRKNRIISVGRITPQKNILNYIRAAHKVIQNNADILFEWFGNTDDPEYEAQCHKLIKELHLEERFKFLSATNNILPEYQQSLALCLPSIYEGFPNVVCEAMSCGLPILCSNICDNPNIVSSGYSGLLFNPHDVDDIAATIIRFLNLPSHDIHKMRRNSREFALANFSEEQFIKHYISIIENE